MTDTSASTPDDAVTGKAIRAWWPIAVGVAAGIAVGAFNWATTRAELGVLHDKTASLEASLSALSAKRDGDRDSFDKLNKRLDKLDQKLALILCAADKAKCTAALMTTSSDDP